MTFLVFLSNAMIPLMIFYIVGIGLLMRQNVYEEFIEGAKEGFRTVVGIMPTLVGLMVAVGVLRASGFLDFVSEMLAGITSLVRFPPELLPLTIVKMFSSSAATSLLLDIYKQYGTDTFLGTAASISMSSTDNSVI